MFVRSITLKDFRNYASEKVEFASGLNILTGANAQGKTNAVEAIFFACTGYSPRANKDKLVIKNNVKYYLTSCDQVDNKLTEIQL